MGLPREQKRALPLVRPAPSTEEEVIRETQFQEKEQEISAALHSYDASLRELYFMERHMTMVDYDPDNARNDKSTLLLAVDFLI